MKSVVEFLWGSPIVTEKSDEDWLIFTDTYPTEYIKASPQLAGPRSKPVDGIRKTIDMMPEFLFEIPFYSCFCLFAQEYYVDAAATTQIQTIISMREDICRMNLPEFYNRLALSVSSWSQGQEKFYRPKRFYKAIKNSAMAVRAAHGASFEEALAFGNQISAPVKLEQLTQKEALELFQEYKNQFEQKEVANFFQQEINYTTYAKLQELVNSIDITKLTGIPVGQN